MDEHDLAEVYALLCFSPLTYPYGRFLGITLFPILSLPSTSCTDHFIVPAVS